MAGAHIHPFAQKLINDLVWRMVKNTVQPGEQLPSIEAMAEANDVGRSTVREALRYIESTGLLYSRHGRGTYVTDFEDSVGGVAFIDEVVDMRRMIELHATDLAVRNRTDDDLERLSFFIDEMKSKSQDFQSYIDADRAFHGAVVQASKSTLLPSLFMNISGIYNGVQMALIHLEPSVTGISIEHHRGIFDGLAARDHDKALRVTAEHLDMISKLFREHGVDSGRGQDRITRNSVAAAS